MTSPTPLEMLSELRDHGGERVTTGLPDATILRFTAEDPTLERAIAEAWAAHRALRPRLGEQLAWPELRLRDWLQADYVNFYPHDGVNPYVPLAARGPWIVTTHGAVLHDDGGYGMLGFGHAPDEILQVLPQPWVVANIMTASVSQRRFSDALRAEVGHTRDGCPFSAFVCMNSGSEAVTVALRISDARARRLTDPGGPKEGRKVCLLALEGGFHGRTDRPAQASSSSLPTYRRHLLSFRDRENLWTIPPNDVPALREAFARAEREGVFFEAMLMEPVMGEGRPGVAADPAFYAEARRLTREAGTLLVVDSIQAGLRAWGVLSVVDYPGFQSLDAPDMETWSKALNAAQYPLSVLALGDEAARSYVQGIYGNTMTANPRALEVGVATLDLLTPEVRRNVVDRGRELKERLEALQRAFPQAITGVTGTGLLVAAELDPARLPVTGAGGVEEVCRRRGLGVIHGGRNALRFTPHLRLTSAEVDLLIEVLTDVLREALDAPPPA